jgi:hypothetical protein
VAVWLGNIYLYFLFIFIEVLEKYIAFIFSGNIVLCLLKLVKGATLQHGYTFEKSELSVGLFQSLEILIVYFKNHCDI